jgi:hypothetical protein
LENRVFRTASLIFLSVAIVIAGDTATYQKGTITKKFVAESGSSAQVYYELEGADRTYELKICADFEDGKTVEFRLKGYNVFIVGNAGKEIRCPTATVSSVVAPVTYEKGTIQGYQILYRVSKGSTGGLRRANVYELGGPDLIYEIDFCGAFQAGQFTIGQVVQYRIDGERLYILHDNDKEYSCQIEGTQKPETANSAPTATPAAVATSTAKLSITSVPDGADIEVDGNFSGNTPSDLEVPEGEHFITVKKSGYKDWQRKMKIVAGSSIHLNAEMEKATNP